ncbi:hypothetical protein CL656_00030 [bacterium]|nr:hypothetical protein [bacterium]|tara:strand:- start:64 stop:1788 length:1725 start_codon:yes stop_codon:yes gene_type:complete
MNKLALISVSNKIGLIELTTNLLKNNYTIISTGGTYKQIQNLSDTNIINIESFTGFPEILNGRVKTLNPVILGGILAKRDSAAHLSDLQKIKSAYIDLVIVNLYPFQEIVSKQDHTLDDAIENIDIGGVTLIRAACKNYKFVKIITDPNDYQLCFSEQDTNNNLYLARKGWDHIANYDISISEYFNPNKKYRNYNTELQLKYGCNPNQNNANLMSINGNNPLKIINGKPGYINLLDAFSSWQLVKEIGTCGYPAAASFKHTAPAGVAIGKNQIDENLMHSWNINGKINSKTAIAFMRARQADPLSSFGDFVAISTRIDKETALLIKKEVSDGIIAPSFDDDALEILKQKKNGNYLIIQVDENYSTEDMTEYRELFGMTLSQKTHNIIVKPDDMTNWVTSISTDDHNILLDLFIANCTLKYTPSNSIVYAYDGQVIGVGAGQQNRVDCVKLAGNKAINWWKRQSPCISNGKFPENSKRQEKVNMVMNFINKNLDKNEIFTKTENDEIHMKNLNNNNIVLASDAFFPFSDNIDEAQTRGVKYIIQPGGSVSDECVINKCNDYNIGMCFTGVRMFYH